MGLHRREIPDRPSLVVLPDFVAGLLQKDTRPRYQAQLGALGLDLLGGHRAEYRRWLAHRAPGAARLQREPRPQDRDVRIGRTGPADLRGDPSGELDRRAVDWPCWRG